MTVKPGPDNRAGTMRTFSASSRDRKRVAIFLAFMSAPVVVLLFIPAVRQQSGLNIWGVVAILAGLAVMCGWTYAAQTRATVIVRDGQVTIRKYRSRTIDVSEIRAMTLESVPGDGGNFWVPTAELADGKRILMYALTCGAAQGWGGRGPRLPPDPGALAVYNEFRLLLGFPPDPQFEVPGP